MFPAFGYPNLHLRKMFFFNKILGPFIILYSEPINAHNYFTNYHTATGFDVIIIIIITAIDLSLGGSSPCNSKDKSNKNIYT